MQHEAFGILGNDTDFLIYPGIQRYLSLSSLKVTDDGQIFVDVIERSLFHRYLGITEEKLPMLVGSLISISTFSSNLNSVFRVSWK